MLRSVFFHFMFRAVAKGNGAVDEHSDKVGDADLWALSDKQFNALMPAPSLADSAYTLSLPQRIVGALADLSPTEYASVRKTHRAGIAIGISEFLHTRQTGPLERALERLAHEIVSGAQPATSDVTRTIVFPFLRILLVMSGGALGGAVGQKFGHTVAGAAAGAGIGKATVELVDQVQRAIEPRISDAASWLLKRSLVRRVEEERTTR
jgi:hypothetical protein